MIIKSLPITQTIYYHSHFYPYLIPMYEYYSSKIIYFTNLIDFDHYNPYYFLKYSDLNVIKNSFY